MLSLDFIIMIFYTKKYRASREWKIIMNKLINNPEKLFRVGRFNIGNIREIGALYWVNAKENYKLAAIGLEQNVIYFNGEKRYLGISPASLSLLQQTYELYLKALLGFSGVSICDRGYKHHDLIKLLEEAKDFYPELQEVIDNKKAYFLLEELGLNFDVIRYCEGTLAFFDVHVLIKIIYFIQEKLEFLTKNASEKNYN